MNDPLLLPPCDVLREIYASGQISDADGQSVRLHSELSRQHAYALYRLVLEAKPETVVEVGMAYGLSTLSILTALRDAGGSGRLISIDPNQSTAWKSIGLENVRRAGFSERHEVMEAPDFTALPQLLERGKAIQFAYIDGWHTFDYALVDFFYIDKLLAAGGVVGFDDCGMAAVHRVLRYVRTHRRYGEIDSGVPPDYQGRNLLYTLARRLLRRPRGSRYFRKEEEWEPAWNFYRPF